MRKLIGALAVIGSMAGCVQTQQAVDSVARDAAKASVNKALVTRFPAVPKSAVTPFTDCIIEASSAREIGAFAQDAVLGVDDETVALISDVIKRPETTKCIAGAGLAALAG